MHATPTAIDAAGAFLAAFDQAVAAAGAASADFAVVGRRVRLRFAGPALIAPMTRALAHRRIASTGEADLTILLWDEGSTGVAAPAGAGLAGPGAPPSRSGAITVAVAPDADMVQAFDCDRRAGFFWARRAEGIPAADLSRPLLNVLHWWLADSPWLLVHAAAIAGAAGGILLAGPGGAGKSTSALACLRAGWRYAGDDFVAVRPRPSPVVDNIYSSGRLRTDMAARFAAFDPVRAPEGAGSIDGKAGYLFAGHVAPQRFGDAPLRAILLPRVEGRAGHALRKATRAEAWTSLAATVTVLRGGDDAALAKIRDLVAALPAFRLSLGPDVEALPGFLARELGIAP